MTKLTRETAFRLMPHSHMTPNMLTRIMAMVRQVSVAKHSSKPNSTVVTTSMDASDKLKFIAVSFTIVRYCS